jgi:hypothetical protein
MASRKDDRVKKGSYGDFARVLSSDAYDALFGGDRFPQPARPNRAPGPEVSKEPFIPDYITGWRPSRAALYGSTTKPKEQQGPPIPFSHAKSDAYFDYINNRMVKPVTSAISTYRPDRPVLAPDTVHYANLPPDRGMITGPEKFPAGDPAKQLLPPASAAPSGFDIVGATVDPWVQGAKDVVGGVGSLLNRVYVDPDAAAATANIDAQPGNAMDPGATGVPMDPQAPPEPAPPITTVGTQQVPYSHFGPELVAPPPTTDTPPAGPAEPPIEEVGVEEGASEPGKVTGGMSIDEYDDWIKTKYPDLDFQNNPKQAEADANARRDLERTGMLAQLAVAAGMVSGAGKSWEGLGQGLHDAGGVYTDQFKKYQDTLQSAADRYADQQAKQVTYNMARTKMGLDLYTSDADRAAEDRRTNIKYRNDRSWDKYKLLHEDLQKQAENDLTKIKFQYEKEFDAIKPSSDNYDFDQSKLDDYYERLERGMREGHYIAPGKNHDVTVAAK